VDGKSAFDDDCVIGSAKFFAGREICRVSYGITGGAKGFHACLCEIIERPTDENARAPLAFGDLTGPHRP
jgi:hypothetical protein